MECSFSSASECSGSPMPENNSVCQKKCAAVEATEEAVQSIVKRNNHLHECEEFDRLNQLKEWIEQYEQKVESYKAKYTQAERKLTGERRETILVSIKKKYESVKRAKKRFDTEYLCIKKQMG